MVGGLHAWLASCKSQTACLHSHQKGNSMPLPLGHFAIGLATHEAVSSCSALSRWKLLAAVVVLSNLPDLDVIIGLLLNFNGSAYHRGPTHSLFFAITAGYLVSRVTTFWSKFPRLSFKVCFLLILSHVAADAFLSDSSVSFIWPLGVYWSTGHTGWGDVTEMVLSGNSRDAWISIGAVVFVSFLCAARVLRWDRLLRSGDNSI